MELQIFKEGFEKRGYNTLLKDDILEVLQCCVEFALPIMEPLMTKHRVDVLISQPFSRLIIMVSNAEDPKNPKLYVTSLSIWVAKTQFHLNYKFERIEALEGAVRRLGDVFISTNIDGDLRIDTYSDRTKIQAIYDKQLICKLLVETDHIQITLDVGLELTVEVKPKLIHNENTISDIRDFINYCLSQAIEHGITDSDELERTYKQK